MRSQLQVLVGRQTLSVVTLAPALSAVLLLLLLDASPVGWLACCLQRCTAVWVILWCFAAVAGNLGGQFGRNLAG